MSNFNMPPVEEGKEELETESDKIEKQREEQKITEGGETGEPFREVEYEKFKGYLEEVLPEFDSKTLNEAKKYIDDLRQEEYENGDNNNLEVYQDLSDAVGDLMSLKSLDVEKTLDKLAQYKFFNLKKLTDEKLGVLNDFKGENTERRDKHNVGALIYQLREAVTNLAEFKYPKLIKEQYKQRYEAQNKKDIEKTKEELNKINIS